MFDCIVMVSALLIGFASTGYSVQRFRRDSFFMQFPAKILPDQWLIAISFSALETEDHQVAVFRFLKETSWNN